jgi:hypothetical protein
MSKADKLRKVLDRHFQESMEKGRWHPERVLRPEPAVDHHLLCWECSPLGAASAMHPKPFLCVRCGRLCYDGRFVPRVEPEWVGIERPYTPSPRPKVYRREEAPADESTAGA